MELISNFFYNISSDIQSIQTPPAWEQLLQTALGTENRISRLLFRSRIASVALRILGISLGFAASYSLVNSIAHPNRARRLLLPLGTGALAHDCLQAGFNIKTEIDALKSSDNKNLFEKAIEKMALLKKALSLLQMDKIERWVHLVCPDTWICQPIYNIWKSNTDSQ